MQGKVRQRRHPLPDNFFQKKANKIELSTSIRPCSPVSTEDSLAVKINLNMNKQKAILDKLKLWQDQISSVSLRGMSIPEEDENEDESVNTGVVLLKK